MDNDVVLSNSERITLETDKLTSKKIRTTNGLYIHVSEVDFEWANKHRWTASRGSQRSDKWYATTKIRGKTHRMHRMILNLEPHDPRVGDHKDDDGLNNMRTNLQILTQRENMLKCPNWKRKI